MYGEYEAINGAIANALIVERDQLASEVNALREALKGMKTIRIWVVYEEDRGAGVTLLGGYTSEAEAFAHQGSNEYVQTIEVPFYWGLDAVQPCPRPINTATDHSVKWCQENGHCGCVAIEGLREAYGEQVYPLDENVHEH